jgi:hypothetical protein
MKVKKPVFRNMNCIFDTTSYWDSYLHSLSFNISFFKAKLFLKLELKLVLNKIFLSQKYIGATPIAGRFTPGSFTNQIQRAFKEPRLIIITDPIADHQPITEASYVNIPIIAFANSDNPLRCIDIAIPCNNRVCQFLKINNEK